MPNATDHDITLTHTPTGGGYGEITVDSVSVTIRDNDTHGITVDPTSLEIAEGERESFTVVLDAEPAGPTRPTRAVTVTVETTHPSLLTLSPLVNGDELTFDSGNWDQPQTVWASATVDPNNTDETGLKINISATDYETRTVMVAIRDTGRKGSGRFPGFVADYGRDQ